MLITLEGIDGSGKSTVWESLHDIYPSAVFTCEPTDSWYGEAVAQSIADDTADPLAELFLYTADHADHLTRVVKPALAEGKLVISDRYADSRYAYQGATLEGVIKRPVEYVHGIHMPFTVTPDLTLYFDVDPDVGANRSGSTNKFERVDQLERVKRNYERLIDSDPGRFVRIDAMESPETVMESVESILNEQITDE